MKGMLNLLFLRFFVVVFAVLSCLSECKTPSKPWLKKVITGRGEMAGRSGSLLRSLRSSIGSSQNAWPRDDAHFVQPHRSFFTINRLFLAFRVLPLNATEGFILCFFPPETEFGPGVVVVLVAARWDNWAATACWHRSRVSTVSL